MLGDLRSVTLRYKAMRTVVEHFRMGTPLPTCATRRLRESFEVRHSTSIGAVTELAEVGRVTPCASSFVPQESVVAGVGAQRTARPTLRFMESLHGSATAHWDHEPRRIPLTRPSGTLSPSGGEGWGEGVRFMESLHSLLRIHRDDELISVGRARLRRALILIAPRRLQGSTESRPTLRFMESPGGQRISLTGTNQELWS